MKWLLSPQYVEEVINILNIFFLRICDFELLPFASSVIYNLGSLAKFLLFRNQKMV